jgi:hypothetical protein
MKSDSKMLPGGGNERRVLIRCPQTGELVPTGLRMDVDAFNSVTLDEYITVCPECGEAHKWSKDAAFLETESNRNNPGND